MRRAAMVLSLAAAAMLLAACGETPQQGGMKKVGKPAWTGTDERYTAPGWKPGDAASWEQQIRNRGRAQNEYERIGGGAPAKSP